MQKTGRRLRALMIEPVICGGSLNRDSCIALFSLERPIPFEKCLKHERY